MTKRILIINGNPARLRESFSDALCKAYSDGAKFADHEVKLVKIADLDFDPILHEGYHGNQPPEPHLAEVQQFIRWSEHIVIVYPMWQLGIPAHLKGFCERVFTPSFAYCLSGKNPLQLGMLKGRSMRLIQTMAMAGPLYALAYRMHAIKAFKSFFGFCGISPVKLSPMGLIESADTRSHYLAVAKKLGEAAI